MADDITSDDLEAAILEDAANGIQRFIDGDMDVTAMNLKDRLAVLDRKKLQAVATSNPNFGLRFTKLNGPSAWG